jgi:hypothetical protein
MSWFTYQKLKVVAVQQDAFLRQQFIIEVTVYRPEMHKTGTDNRNLVHKYGYSMRGKPLKTHSFFVRGERVLPLRAYQWLGFWTLKLLIKEPVMVIPFTVYYLSLPKSSSDVSPGRAIRQQKTKVQECMERSAHTTDTARSHGTHAP